MADLDVRAWRWLPGLRSCTALALLSGCAPDVLARAELDEVCGQPAPVRLLETDPDLTLAGAGQATVSEGRRILSVSYLDETESDDFPHAELREIWSVGECGESPIRLANDLGFVAYPEVWPETIWAAARRPAKCSSSTRSASGRPISCSRSPSVAARRRRGA